MNFDNRIGNDASQASCRDRGRTFCEISRCGINVRQDLYRVLSRRLQLRKVGRVTTRGLLQRVQQLVLATTRFAGGDYTQRVEPHHQDEIGQLEPQFNQMAEELVENIVLQSNWPNRMRAWKSARVSRANCTTPS